MDQAEFNAQVRSQLRYRDNRGLAFNDPCRRPNRLTLTWAFSSGIEPTVFVDKFLEIQCKSHLK